MTFNKHDHFLFIFTNKNRKLYVVVDELIEQKIKHLCSSTMTDRQSNKKIVRLIVDLRMCVTED